MDTDERIEELESIVKRLHAELEVAAKTHLHFYGSATAYHRALLALVSHPVFAGDELLRTVLADSFQRTEAQYNGTATAEEQIDGFQHSQKAILLAVHQASALQDECTPDRKNTNKD